MDLLSKLYSIKERWLNIQEQLSDPELIKDMKKYKALNKDYRDMEPVVEALDIYSNILKNIDDSRNILNTEKDTDLKDMAKAELEELDEKKK